jgi:hypothetical protein
MHVARSYGPRKGAILCHYLSAGRAVNCDAANVANYFKFAAVLLVLLAVPSVCLQESEWERCIGLPHSL